jgi:hypothetical protein
MKKVIDITEEFRVLDAINEAMLRRNFSSHRRQRTPEQFAVLEMRNVRWNDSGSPERILLRLDNYGKPRAAVLDPLLHFIYVG